MTTLLYGAWIALPLFFFLTALWGKLETASDKRKREDVRDFFYQGIFVSVCVGIAIIIDQYFLEAIANSLAPEYLPLGFFQVILLPFILLVAAKVIGPSADIRITKAPRPTERKRGHR